MEIENTVTIIRTIRKGNFLNSLEKYYIFLASKEVVRMNEFNIDQSNTIFQTMNKKVTKHPHE
jgi:hypothetical protein